MPLYVLPSSQSLLLGVRQAIVFFYSAFVLAPWFLCIWYDDFSYLVYDFLVAR